jgi:hypothetical protein
MLLNIPRGSYRIIGNTAARARSCRAILPVVTALLTISLLSTRTAGAAVQLPANAAECIRWAAQDVESALQEAHVRSQARVSVAIHGGGEVPPEGFALIARPEAVRIVAGDAVGAMYGLLELAEQIRNGGSRDRWSRVAATLSSTTQRPFLEYRADNAFIHATDQSLAFDVDMWKAYIDGLARCRFNVLDLHGGYDLRTTRFPNLYPLLVHVPEYPTVGDPVLQRRNLAAFKAIVAYARRRGIKVAFMNYSVGGVPLQGDQLADYSARAVAMLLREVPDLYMLGFRVGESGERADFFKEAYLRGVALSGRKNIRLYTRSWQTTQDALEAIGQASHGSFDIEIKYNGEQLGLPYQAIGKGGRSYSYQGYVKAGTPYRVIWQVRANGTHRFWAWADTGFIRRAVRSFSFGRARGFSLEPHIAYFDAAAAPYYRSPKDQSVYRYIWQKYWMWYFLWGRLSYDPQLPEATLIAAFQRRFGAPGKAIYQAMQASGPIVPLVCAYRYQGPDQRDWSPETETGCFAHQVRGWNHMGLGSRARLIGVEGRGSFDALSYDAHPPMDPSAFAGIQDFVEGRMKELPEGRVGPAWVARLLTDAARATRAVVAQAGNVGGRAGEEWRLLKTDLLCACDLGEYHAARILGVTHLLYATRTGSGGDYEAAVQYLAQSRDHWKALAERADAVYMPRDNPLRRERQYRWSLPLPLLERLDATAPLLWSQREPDPSAKPLRLTPADEGEDPGIRVTEVQHVLRSGDSGPSASAEISCQVSAQAGIERVVLWHRELPSESTWEQQPMFPGAGSEATATIPVTPAGLLYFVEVQDRQGQARRFPPVLEAPGYWVIDPWEVRSAAALFPLRFGDDSQLVPPRAFFPSPAPRQTYH